MLLAAILYATAGALLLTSLARDRDKTRVALRKATRMFLTVLPQFLAVVILAGVGLAIVRPDRILMLLGNKASMVAATIAAAAGSVAMIPVITVLPVVSQLHQEGANLMPISVFLATLTTVGFATLPLESKYIGRRLALLRNTLAFGCAILVALFISALIG